MTSRRHPAHRTAASQPGQIASPAAAIAAARGAELAVENRELRRENEQLVRALASRSVIDQARGMVMALAPCSTDQAWGVMVDVPQHCNVKLRDVAAALVALSDGEALAQPVRRELCRALRRLHRAGPS
ncbi:ANTAR domain-containing protein [Streptomyces sp. NBC_00687]|uniref:ANTAR domain-containing protein n=1 Tax=Streptomyces sp. NBC_00687 TaxID=2975807 RepID=UPI00225C2B64|nr:ANTAR domain-containing protein [Streptomyces sp. NBC_00687]MCX4918126.1 ANTAR domain-containing protein [Streptomyces sp. NBC_00687]